MRDLVPTIAETVTVGSRGYEVEVTYEVESVTHTMVVTDVHDDVPQFCCAPAAKFPEKEAVGVNSRAPKFMPAKVISLPPDLTAL